MSSFCLTKGLWGSGKEMKESSSRGGVFYTQNDYMQRERDLSKVTKDARGSRSTDCICVSPGARVGPLRLPRVDMASLHPRAWPSFPNLGIRAAVGLSTVLDLWGTTFVSY